MNNPPEFVQQRRVDFYATTDPAYVTILVYDNATQRVAYGLVKRSLIRCVQETVDEAHRCLEELGELVVEAYEGLPGGGE